MMGVWTAMSKLQDIAPWSGLRTSRGYTSFSSGTSLGRWWDDDDLTPGVPRNTEPFRNGGGPKTGFAVGDRVVGYPGPGEVVEVTEHDGRADSVRVKFDSGKTVTITSNFLMAEPDDEHGGGEDLDRVYELCEKALAPGADTKPVTEFPAEEAGRLSQDAFDLLVRVQGEIEAHNDFTREDLMEVYDEILWEYSTDDERLDVFGDAAAVPAKYEHEAIKLFSGV
jgi:hypothetical protein